MDTQCRRSSTKRLQSVPPWEPLPGPACGELQDLRGFGSMVLSAPAFPETTTHGSSYSKACESGFTSCMQILAPWPEVLQDFSLSLFFPPSTGYGQGHPNLGPRQNPVKHLRGKPRPTKASCSMQRMMLAIMTMKSGNHNWWWCYRLMMQW